MIKEHKVITTKVSNDNLLKKIELLILFHNHYFRTI